MLESMKGRMSSGSKASLGKRGHGTPPRKSGKKDPVENTPETTDMTASEDESSSSSATDMFVENVSVVAPERIRVGPTGRRTQGGAYAVGSTSLINTFNQEPQHMPELASNKFRQGSSTMAEDSPGQTPGQVGTKRSNTSIKGIRSTKASTHKKKEDRSTPRSDSQPRGGSWADALGLALDPSSTAPPAIQHAKATKVPLFLSQAGSVADALGIPEAPSSGDVHRRELDLTDVPRASRGVHHGFLRQAGDVVDALGLGSSTQLAPSGRKGSTAVTSTQGDSFYPSRKRRPPLDATSSSHTQPNHTFHEHDGVTSEGTSIASEEEILQFTPQAGSLFEALGVAVDPSSRVAFMPQTMMARDIEDRRQYQTGKEVETNDGKSFIRFASLQPGSLAEASGVAMEGSSAALPTRQSTASMEDSDSYSDSTSDSSSDSSGYGDDDLVRFAPQPGSLAEALGLSVYPSSGAPLVRQPEYRVAGEHVVFQPKSGSLAEALGFTAKPLLRTTGGGGSDKIQQEHSQNHVTSTSRNNLGPGPLFAAASGSLADALGLTVHPSSQAPSFHAAHSGAAFDPSDASSDSASDSDSSDDGTPVRISAQPGSLASALGIGVDPSSRAPPVRYAGNKMNEAFHPSTQWKGAAPGYFFGTGSLGTGYYLDQATLVDSVVLRTVNGNGSKISVGLLEGKPQIGSLAAALDMRIDTSSEALPVRAVKAGMKSKSLFEAVISQSVQAAMPKKGPRSDKQPAAGSLAAALGMGIVTSSGAPAMTVQTTKSVKEGRSKSHPAAGSLAAALGMSIDTSSRVPAIAVQTALFSKASRLKSHPAAGSLAAALGMTIDTSSGAPAMAVQMTKSAKDGRLKSQPAAGSLAAALGMTIDTSSGAPAMTVQTTKSVKESRSKSHPAAGSLAAAVGMTNDTSSGALVMRIDTSSEALPVRAVKAGMKSKSLFEAVISQSVQAAMPKKGPRFDKQPAAGSLAAALGMSIDTSSGAPAMTVQMTQSAKDGRLKSHPAAGSLAAALGMTIDTSSRVPAIAVQTALFSKASRSTTKPAAGSDASLRAPPFRFSGQKGNEALSGCSFGTGCDGKGDFLDQTALVDSAVLRALNGDDSKISVGQLEGKPQAGSLAAELDTRFDTSSDFLPVTAVGASTRPKSLFDAVMTKSVQASMPKNRSRFDNQPAAGSLAAALGMRIETSAGCSVKDFHQGETACNKKVEAEPAHGLAPHIQPESLAAARGAPTHPKPDAGQNSKSHVRAGSLAAALGAPDGVRDQRVAEYMSNGCAQAGSLAAALGAPVSRQTVLQDYVRSNDAHVHAGSLAAALGAPTYPKPNPIDAHKNPRSHAMAGSLAAALGAPVAPSREQRVAEFMSNGCAQAGSLAAALGAPVRRQHVHQEPARGQSSHVKAGSLAAALGAPTYPEPNASRNSRSHPTTGALGAALGASVAPSREQRVAKVQAQAGSLAAALGAPVSRQTVPQESAHGNAANVQAGSLAEALGATTLSKPNGMSSHPNSKSRVMVGSLAAALCAPIASSRQEVVSVHMSHVQAQAGSLAAALGGPVSRLHVHQESTRGNAAHVQAGSLAAALGAPASSKPYQMDIHNDSSRHAMAGSQAASLGVPVVPLREEIVSEPMSHVQAQAGSLAAALGAPVRRQPVHQESTRGNAAHVQAGSLAAALGASTCSKPYQMDIHNDSRRHAMAGSLAAALSAPFAPMRQQLYVDNTSSGFAQEGSLAAALGAPVSSMESLRSNAAHDQAGSPAAALGAPTYPKPHGMDAHQISRSQAMAGSLAAALGAPVAPSREQRVAKNISQVQAQAGSLAAALGAPVRRQPVHQESTRGNATHVQAGSLAAALGAPTYPKSNPIDVHQTSRSHAMAGSLAAALGAPIAPSGEQRFAENISQVQAQAGNLAAALGAPVSRHTVHQESTRGNAAHVQAGSLAAALGAPTYPKPNPIDVHQISRSHAMAGSLAAALGAPIAPSGEQRFAENISQVQAQAGSLAAALGAPVRIQTVQQEPSRGNALQVHTGSLAAALVAPTYPTLTLTYPKPHGMDPHKNPKSRAMAGALGAALGAPIAPSREQRVAEKISKVQAQAGSLAAALGAPVSRQSVQQETIFINAAHVQAGSLAAGHGAPMYPKPNNKAAHHNPRSHSMIGSLVTALGEPIAPSRDKSVTEPMPHVHAKAGSLAVALGAPDSQKTGLPEWVRSDAVDVQAGSFAATLGAPADPKSQKSTRLSISSSDQLPSLSTEHASTAKSLATEQMSTVRSKTGTLAAALGTSVNSVYHVNRSNNITLDSGLNPVASAFGKGRLSLPAPSSSKEKKKQRSVAAPANDSMELVGAGAEPSRNDLRMALFKPQPMTTEEKQTDKERAMARLQRMKAKAIKSANKELGVDESVLASLMGVTAHVLCTDEAQGAIRKESPETAVQDISSGRSKGIQSVVQVDETNVASTNRMLLSKIQGKAVDEPVVRERSFKPQPVTAEEKRADKQRAMTRLERIKAKAIKSAQRELGVDVDGLASAMGMNTHKSDSKVSKKNSPTMPSENEAEQMEFLAESLGLPPSFFGVGQSRTEKTAQSAALNLQRIRKK